ncbi:MAG: hypothetical protein WAZ77_15615 [Candidatus Nitrosopolaris sp.]|jgi:multiple sugar transport system substrate-binding protein
MMGGWELAIPQTSKNKDLAWELLTIMVDSKIIGPWLEQNGFLPTQKSLGSGLQSAQLNQTIPYYNKMNSMILTGHGRPNVSEYPQIADHIRLAIEEVYYGIKEPKQALDDAACKGFRMVGVTASLSISEKDFQFKRRYKSCYHSLSYPIAMKEVCHPVIIVELRSSG